jgi:ankyrin repeat protein/uncharacterized glyoxalase superfamily protein PhnB
MMTKFNNPVPILNVKNFAEAMDYYINKLGFKKNWDWGDPPTFGAVGRDKTEIFLCEGGQGQPGMWMWIGVENVDDLHNEYKEKGAVILEPPVNYPWGSREMLVEDIDGHRFRLASESTGPPDYQHLNTARFNHEIGVPDITPMPITAKLSQYERLAERLFAACKAGDEKTIRLLKERPNLVKAPVPDLTSNEFSLSDAQLIVARFYQFESWSRLAEYVSAVVEENSAVAEFESAVDAVIAGDVAKLELLLSANPELVRARSMRRHQAMLIHYVGANLVEGYRQKSPENAVEILKILLRAGAEADAVVPTGGKGTTLGLVATSSNTKLAGTQIGLIDVLLDAGANIEGAPDGYQPLAAALANGCGDAAAHLAKRGARVESIVAAAGVGRLDLVKSYLNEDGSLKPEVAAVQAFGLADDPKTQVEQAFHSACAQGRIEIAEFLLDKGVDIASGAVTGQTGLHIAAHAGQLEMVKVLLERKAPLEVKNMYGGTVLGQALWSAYNEPQPDHLEIIDLLIEAGAVVGPDRERWIGELRRRQRSPDCSA